MNRVRAGDELADDLGAFLRRAVARLEWSEGNVHCMTVVPLRRRQSRFHVLRVWLEADAWKVEAGLSEASFDVDEPVTIQALRGGRPSASASSASEAMCTAGSNTVRDLAQDRLGLRIPHDDRASAREAGLMRDTCLSIALALRPRGTAVNAWLGRGCMDLVARQAFDMEGLAYHAGGSDAARRRRQAAILHPMFASRMHRMPGVALAIDAGLPFEPLLGEALASHRHAGPGTEAPSASLATIRRMRTLDTFVPGLTSVVRVATRLPPGWLPPTSGGWDHMSGPAVLADILQRRLGLEPRDLLAPGRWGWEKFSVSLQRHHGLDATPSSTSEWLASHVDDAAAHLAGTLTLPLLSRGGACPDRDTGTRLAARLLFEGLGMSAVLKATDRHHRDASAIEEAIPLDPGRGTWPRLFETQRLGEGIEVVSLSSPGELADEGRTGPGRDGVDGLGHCVAAYASGCRSGWAHILSIRRRTDMGYERLATARLTFDLGVVTIEEVKGLRNAPPPPAATEACRVLASRFAEGSLKPPDGPDPGSDLIGRDAELWDRYPPDDAAALAAATEAWRPYLARPHKGVTVEALLAMAAASKPAWHVPT